MSHYTPSIYKRDTKGKLRIWYAEIVGECWRVVTGIDGGKLTESEWTRSTTKNKGKANEVIPEVQAGYEAYAKRDVKLRQDWHSTPDCSDWKPPFPMLAEKWEDEKHLKALELGSVVNSQPKLDGVRCLAFLKEGRIKFYSREGQPFPDFPHIRQALEPFFKENPQVILDGELYNHEYHDDFNAIVSAVKAGRVEQAQLLQYHVYDRADGIDRFSWRFSWLKAVLTRLAPSPHVVVVQTHLVTNAFTLNTLRDHYLSQGYEGQILRLDAPYEQGKRSKTLLKRKEFMDEEFPLVNIEEGVGNYSRCAKKATFRLPDGRTFKAQVKGPRGFLMVLLEQWTKLVACQEDGFEEGSIVSTVKFFQYTPDGIPRFPTVKTIWWEGRDV